MQKKFQFVIHNVKGRLKLSTVCISIMSIKIGSHLAGGIGCGLWQTTMSLECGQLHSHKCRLNQGTTTAIHTYRRSWNCCDRRTCFVVIWKHFCFILSMDTKIRIDSVMCLHLLVGSAIQVPQLQLQVFLQNSVN